VVSRSKRRGTYEYRISISDSPGKQRRRDAAANFLLIKMLSLSICFLQLSHGYGVKIAEPHCRVVLILLRAADRGRLINSLSRD
jgi:hypothetical protein